MKVFVTGGSGFAGSTIVSRLVEVGHTVTALARSSSSARKVEALGAKSWSGDLADPESLRGGLESQDCVVHCAAHFQFHGPSQPFFEINVKGTQSLLRAAREAGVSRFMFISAAAVVMDDEGKPLLNVDETYPVNSGSRFPYIASKAEAETLVLRANDDKMKTLALRPPSIWGPGDAYSKRLPKAVRRLSFAWIDGGNVDCVTCHVNNLAEAVQASLVSGEGGQAYFINDPAPVAMRDFLLAIGRANGLRLDRFPSVPYQVAKFFGAVVERAWAALRFSGEPPLTTTMVRLIGKPFVTNDSLARRQLGYKSSYDLGKGLREYVIDSK